MRRDKVPCTLAHQRGVEHFRLELVNNYKFLENILLKSFALKVLFEL